MKVMPQTKISGTDALEAIRMKFASRKNRGATKPIAMHSNTSTINGMKGLTLSVMIVALADKPRESHNGPAAAGR